MHFKQIGILIGGGGLLIFAAAMNQPSTDNLHEEPQAVAAQPVSAVPTSDNRASLTVPTPQGFRSEETSAGLSFVQDGQLRSPLMVRIDLQSDPDVANATEQRQLQDGLARYKIEEFEGGSGGPLWQLSAVKETPKGALVMQASQQAEFGPPDFSKAWAIFEGAEIKD